MGWSLPSKWNGRVLQCEYPWLAPSNPAQPGEKSVDQSPARSESSSRISDTLLERVRAQQPEAWGRLVRLYGPLVYRWSRQCGLQAADAADTVQEVFRAVWANVSDFHAEQPSDSFRGWLWTITRNKVRDHFRRQTAATRALGEPSPTIQFQEVPQEEPEQGDSQTGVATLQVHRTLESVRHEFEDSTWEAFWRITVQGQTSAEAAAALNMTKSAARQAKYRVLRRLRRELQ